MRCGECGNKNLKLENIKGTTHPWKDFVGVELLQDQEVLVCQNCKNKVLSLKNINELERNIRNTLHEKTCAAIKRLAKELGLTQEQLAVSLGVTPEYVSKVKNKKAILSFTLFNLLQSFSIHPDLISQLTGVKVRDSQGSFHF